MADAEAPGAKPPAAPAPAAPDLPMQIRMTEPYGFIDANGRRRWWNPGEVVSDAPEIEMLIGRGAPVEFL